MFDVFRIALCIGVALAFVAFCCLIVSARHRDERPFDGWPH